jgi:hypothetical protein
MQAPQVDQTGATQGEIPFVVGSNLYRESPFSTTTLTLGANSQETVLSITPGGFLRGVIVQVTSTGGVLGAGVLANDVPYSIISTSTLEDISGGAILYPLSGYAHAMSQKYFRPWDGDPSKRAIFSASINPAFTLRFFPEVKQTLGVLSNTDARAQYRYRFTLAAGTTAGPNGLTTTAPTTLPTVTVKVSIATWAQPDSEDLLGNTIDQIPLGLNCSRFINHENPNLLVTNRCTLVGNEIRALGFIIRNGDANHTRVDLTDGNAGVLQLYKDQRTLWKQFPSQWIEEMNAFYQFLADGTSTRETGLFVLPRYGGPGANAGASNDGQGEYWLQTVEQTYLHLDLGGTGDITTSPGNIEIIYDVLAIAGTLDPSLEGI